MELGLCNHGISSWNPEDPYEQEMLGLQEGDIPMKAGGIGGWYRDGHQSFWKTANVLIRNSY